MKLYDVGTVAPDVGKGGDWHPCDCPVGTVHTVFASDARLLRAFPAVFLVECRLCGAVLNAGVDLRRWKAFWESHQTWRHLRGLRQ